MIKLISYLFFKRKAILLALDIIIISISTLVSSITWLGIDEGLNYVHANLISYILMLFVFLLFFYIAGIYNRSRFPNRTEWMITILTAALLSLPVSALLIYLFKLVMIGRKVFLLHGFIVIFGIIHIRLILDRLTDQPAFRIRTAVIGLDRQLIENIEETITRGKIGLELISINIKSIEELETKIRENQIEQIVAADRNLSEDLIYSLSGLVLKGIRIFDIPQFFQEYFHKIPVDFITNDWLYNELKKKRQYMPYFQNIKKIMDLTLSAVGFVISVPFYIPIGLFIKLTSKGPVFYRQERLGERGRSFYTIKFRTMVDEAEKETGVVWASDDDERITVAGKFLRKTRMDELPQLINVLKGEMSLIGPRPEREEFIRSFINKTPLSIEDIKKNDDLKKIPYYAIRLLVKPGITGWAQVNIGYVNSNIGTKEKLEYELYYILNQSILLDLSILFKTISIVLLRRGI